MEESGAILNQISYLKDSLDQVNREIEASIQITREIESEIVGCNEIETELAARESELMKACYALEFEVGGYATLTANSKASVKSMEEELSRQKSERDELLAKIDSKREGFVLFCNAFQRKIQADQTVTSLASQKELLENEYELLIRKDKALCHSVSAFVEDVLEELKSAISGMVVAVGVTDSGPKVASEKVQKNKQKNKVTEDSNRSQKNEMSSQGSKRRHENIVADDDLNDKKANKRKELTLQDMYNNTDGFEDEEDDSDWEPCSIVADDNLNDKKATKRKDLTMQDMYNETDEFEDEEDDSDWEPCSEPPRLLTWFCCNCTMANLVDVHHCDTCGEHKESGILKHGFLASPFLQHDANQEFEANGNHSDLQSDFSSETTAVGFDERMLLHSEVELKPHPHPERPDRLRAIAAGLATAGIYPGKCFPICAREITKEELLQVHSQEHIEAVDLTSHVFSSYFTSDTYANEHSACAARLAAGLCADLASSIYSGKVKNGFALVRPPGHHAGVRDSMGFCLHNNAAIAALAAQVAGAKKVLILDWDVHHGNGTQEIFEQNKSVLYISLHRHEKGKFYPGTGAANEVGSLGGEGFCVNIPWSRGGVGDKDYIFAFEHVVMPIANEFAPDFVIVSAGFDAARGDPLGCCDVTPAGYGQMTHMLNALAGGKLLVILEGGYNLRSISSSATAVIKVLLGESPDTEWVSGLPSKSGLMTVLEVLRIQNEFWSTLEPLLIQLQSQWGSYIKEKTSKQSTSRNMKSNIAYIDCLLKVHGSRFLVIE
ncbi:unnamed protein product [Rhodiola kirilowii]